MAKLQAIIIIYYCHHHHLSLRKGTVLAFYGCVYYMFEPAVLGTCLLMFYNTASSSVKNVWVCVCVCVWVWVCVHVCVGVCVCVWFWVLFHVDDVPEGKILYSIRLYCFLCFIQDDDRLHDVNVKQKVDAFLEAMSSQVSTVLTFSSATVWYSMIQECFRHPRRKYSCLPLSNSW